MDELKRVLEENAREYYTNAIEAENKKHFNSSVTLFFKALSSLCDLFIVINEGIMPSNHTERFRILEQKFSNIYGIIDKDFPFYQGGYKSKLNKETSEVLKNDAKRLFEILNIKL